MVFQMNPFLKEEGTELKLMSKKFKENKVVKQMRFLKRENTLSSYLNQFSYPSRTKPKKGEYTDEDDLDELLKTMKGDSVV